MVWLSVISGIKTCPGAQSLRCCGIGVEMGDQTHRAEWIVYVSMSLVCGRAGPRDGQWKERVLPFTIEKATGALWSLWGGGAGPVEEGVGSYLHDTG